MIIGIETLVDVCGNVPQEVVKFTKANGFEVQLDIGEEKQIQGVSFIS